MTLRIKLAAAAALVLLLLPNAAYADGRDRCDDSGTEDNCRDKREKPKFQTKFFSE